MGESCYLLRPEKHACSSRLLLFLGGTYRVEQQSTAVLLFPLGFKGASQPFVIELTACIEKMAAWGWEAHGFPPR